MSFYTSLTGLNSATAQLAVTANNIANVGTSGFKRSRADFGDIFSTSPLQKASAAIGQGVLLKQVSQEFSQGNISTSGNSLDLAITGDGFFPLRSPDGLQDIYTRNGSFSLNDQNNVVNSTGQRLLAASVDSSGKADLTNLAPLSIPPKTSGQAKETKRIQLGLNLPSASQVIEGPFDRTNPATYNKSTALTVYDSGGNGYLATVYYKKTRSASQDSPYSKWQTYFYVGNTLVKPGLQQKTDSTGSPMYINKYGDVLPKSDSRVIPGSGKTEMYTYDEQTKELTSAPAVAVSGAIDPTNLIDATGYLNLPATGQFKFNIKVDGDTTAREVTLPFTSSDEFRDPEKLAGKLEVQLNNQLGQFGHYGLTVAFDKATKTFSVSSGTTGDASSISITPIADTTDAAYGPTSDFLGIRPDVTSLEMLAQPAGAKFSERGRASLPAVMYGDQLAFENNKSISIGSSNKTFTVTVDNITSTVTLEPRNYTMDSLAQELQKAINGQSPFNPITSDTGRKVQGVTVKYENRRLVFTTGTTGELSSIQVSQGPDANLGLGNTTLQQGKTAKYIELTQYKENGTLQYVKNGAQTELSAGVAAKTEWWPVYLDRGELSFDLTGKTVSPLQAMPFETAFLDGGKGALTMSIDFTQTTQYSSTFAVLSQSQDGAPEGDLMGLNIGVDGLVNATYSNGSQISLGKIVLANFSSPSGLRQSGDASYLASTTSGAPKVGEAGSAGFGSLRAGATERANVDLTQELVDLINAQRSFQANAKAIETNSTMTQAVINLRS